MVRKCVALSLSATMVLAGCGSNGITTTAPAPAAAVPVTSAPVIKHVVVIFGENISFDHYFGSYPNARNLAGETQFTAASGTPTNISNYISTPALLTANPNLSAVNGVAASNPYRLTPAQAGTADQDHNYSPEQTAFDGGKMDMFPLSVGTADTAQLATQTGASSLSATTALTMGYYDGNTVTAMWNYAQHYALNDHAFGSTFGPSTPGALNLISGQTNGVSTNLAISALGTAVASDGQGGYTDENDADPAGDLCSSTSKNFSMTGKNIGDLMNAAGVSWGWFQGGFNLGATNTSGTGSTTGCARATASVYIPDRPVVADYVPHHEPFQYYASTQNLTHVRPASVATIGTAADTGAGTANHQYDTADFDAALAAGNLPAVSFLKAASYQDAHAGYSDPLDEQAFVVKEINEIENSTFWSSTAIIINYDDSDGWYDHMTDFVNGSAVAGIDTLNGSGVCISTTAAAAALPGPNSNGKPVQGRCGHGPRLPMLVISPWAQKNFIDNTQVDQASIIRFIEDTFLSSARIGTGSFDASAGTLNNMFNFTNNVAPNPNVVLLNPATGVVTSGN